MYTELKVKTVITKKPHTCSWCDVQIVKGSFSVYRAYIYDGSFRHDWMHPWCADEISQLDWAAGDGFSPGEFA